MPPIAYSGGVHWHAKSPKAKIINIIGCLNVNLLDLAKEYIAGHKNIQTNKLQGFLIQVNIHEKACFRDRSIEFITPVFSKKLCLAELPGATKAIINPIKNIMEIKRILYLEFLFEIKAYIQIVIKIIIVGKVFVKLLPDTKNASNAVKISLKSIFLSLVVSNSIIKDKSIKVIP